MTKSEIAQLLAMIASFDHRRVTDADVAAWKAVADYARWTWATASRAVVEWHAREARRTPMKPADITDYLDTKRAELRKQIFGNHPLVPPSSLDGDVRAEMEWRKAVTEQATTRALDAWATGQPIPALRELTA